MTEYRFVVLSNAVEGRDAEYDDWYNNRHIHDVLKVPGITRGQRFVWDNESLSGGVPPSHRYLAIYEIHTDDLNETLNYLYKNSGTDLMPLSDAMAQDSVAVFYRVSGPVVERAPEE